MDLKLICKIKPDGSLEIPDSFKDRQRKLIEVSHTKHGGYVRAWIKTPDRSKTPRQNNKFHAMCSEIGVLLGHSMEDVKRYVKQMATDEFGYPPEIDDAGNIVTDLWGNVNGKSVAAATVEEVNLLIEAAYLFASRQEIILSEFWEGQ